MVGSDSDTRTTAGMFASIREFQPHAGLGLRDPQPTLTYEYQDWTFIDNFAFDGNNVYSKYQRFSTDDTLNSSHQYQMHHLGYTLDPQRYSDDPRIHNERDGIWVERVQGQSFLYMSSQFASTGLAIYRLQGNVAVPAGYMQLDPSVNNWPGGISHSGWWSWTDDNADGQMQRSEIETQILPGLASGSWAWNTDSHGDIWVVPEIPDRTSHHFTVYHFPLERIDTKGVPHYARIDHADLDRSLSDSQFGRIERFIYQASNDAAFISGFRPTDSAFNRGWGAVGTTLCRYDHWSNPEKRALRWSVNLPFSLSLPRVFDAQNASATFPKVLTLAGKKLFIVYSSPAWIQVIDADTGALTSQPIQAEKRFGGSMMLTDMPYGATASVRPNGNTVLSVEEDDRGKNMIYVFTKGML